MKSFTSFLIGAIVIFAAVFYASDELLGLDNSNKFTEKFKEIVGLDKSEETVDENEPLEVSVSEETRNVVESVTAIPVVSNKEISIQESNRLSLVFVEDKDGKKHYVLEVTTIEIGSNPIAVTFIDSAGNSQEYNFIVVRQSTALPFGETFIGVWPDFKYTLDADNLLAQVDKEHRLLGEYIPTDLVNLKENYINLYVNSADFTLRQDAADYLDIMLNKMREETGKNVVVASSFRSYNEQVSLYSYWLSNLGQEEADKVSARPGFSEHQLGTVVDFINDDSNFEITNEFASTPAGQWLNANAWKYGFVKSYPEGKESVTGYQQEEWHWRYVGVDNAKEFNESGLTLKEWLEEKN
jgi:LAS superfamily LD-carboxypeptidase LdcB